MVCYAVIYGVETKRQSSKPYFFSYVSCFSYDRKCYLCTLYTKTQSYGNMDCYYYCLWHQRHHNEPHWKSTQKEIQQPGDCISAAICHLRCSIPDYLRHSRPSGLRHRLIMFRREGRTPPFSGSPPSTRHNVMDSITQCLQFIPTDIWVTYLYHLLWEECHLIYSFCSGNSSTRNMPPSNTQVCTLVDWVDWVYWYNDPNSKNTKTIPRWVLVLFLLNTSMRKFLFSILFSTHVGRSLRPIYDIFSARDIKNGFQMQQDRNPIWYKCSRLNTQWITIYKSIP